METIDLGGDKSHLIDLVYGPPKECTNSTTSTSVSAPMVENNSKHKRTKNKEKSRVVCSVCTVFFLFLLTLATIAFSVFATYYETKQYYEKQLAMVHFAPQVRRNMSDLAVIDEIHYEEEEPLVGPTLEDMKLPATTIPIWYNLTIKSFLPGYTDFPEKDNFLTNGHVSMKIRAVEDTTKIVLNSVDLNVDEDLSQIKLFSESRSNRIRRNLDVADNSTETTSLIEDVESAETSESTTESTTELTDSTTTPTESTTTPSAARELYPSDLKVTSVKYNKTLQQVTFELDGTLAKEDDVILEFNYEGRMNGSMNGLSSTTYRTKDGEMRNVATARSNLRKLVPCFDDSASRAIWKISIVHPTATNVIGNTDIEKEEQIDENWVKTSLKETLLVPPTLIGFHISDFLFNDGASHNNIPVRVWCRPEAVNNTQFVLDSAVKTINYLEKTYGIPFPYEKHDILLDSTTTESSSSSGLLILSESDSLFDSSRDGITTKVAIAKQIAHKITKQYLETVVSPSDEHSIWLNRALAHHLQYDVINKILEDGEVNTSDLEVAESLEPLLRRDTQSTSHPIFSNIDTPEDVYLSSDEVATLKGAAVLRMLKLVIGEETFTEGLRVYLSSNIFGSTDFANLWKHMNTALPDSVKGWDGEHFDVDDFVTKWIVQMGYPVLDVYRVDENTVEITQRRFKIDNLTPEKAKYRNAKYWYKWDIPLFMEINGEAQPMKWLHEAYRQPLNLSDTLLLNTNSLGFYRVNYDEMGWQKINDQLNKDHTVYSSPVRSRVLSDVFALAKSRQLPYETALDMTAYLEKETEYLPTLVAIDGLSYMYDQLEDTAEDMEMKKLILERITPLFEKIDQSSWKSDSAYSDVKRKLAVSSAFCTLNPIGCKKNMMSSQNILEKCQSSNFTSECSETPDSIRSLIYCKTVAGGDEEVFETMYNFTKMEVSSSERRALVESLACSQNPHLLKRLLREAFDPSSDVLSEEDLPVLMKSMAKNPVGQLFVSEHFIDSWKTIHEKLENNPEIMRSILSDGVRIENNREIEEMERFLARHKYTTQIFGEFKSKLELARSNLHWKMRNEKLVSSYEEEKKKEEKEL